MSRFILPIILIGIAISVFFIFTNSLYGDVSSLREEIVSYNEALDNSKALESERDKLTAKYNSIDPNDLDRLQKLLPNNVDNVRLILEIGQLAAPYGMVLKDVKYNVAENSNQGVVSQGGQQVPRDYGVFDLEFSTSGTYDNFINFSRDIEKNLRIVDISSVTFSSISTGANTRPDVYNYNFKIKTYWLKN